MSAVTLIEIPSWGNATLIEGLWLLSGLLALAVAGAYIPRLRKDWLLAIESKRPVLRTVAAGHLRREIIRFGQGLFIVGIGLYASLEPPAIPGPARTSITGLVLTAALIGVSVLITAGSISDWHTWSETTAQVASDLASENAILLVNGAGEITYANGVAEKVFGRRLVGLVVEDLIPERLRVAHREHRAHFSKSPTTRPMGIDLGTVGLHADGSEVPIFATLSPFTDELGESYTMVTAKLG